MNAEAANPTLGSFAADTETSKSSTCATRPSNGVRQIAIIARKEFSDRFRSGWVIACALVWLGAIAFTSIFGLVQIGRIGVQGYERTAISLLNLVQYLVPLLGLLIGHDLIVREREDRTLNLVLAAGITRARLLCGKFVGAVLTLATPLLLGFLIAGIVIGFAAGDKSFAPFLKLAISGLGLGIVFCGIGLFVSTISRSRVQALVFALLSWGFAVFAFDLIAMGIIVSTNAVKASQEIEVICDATHVNSQADIHAAFDAPAQVSKSAVQTTSSESHAWVWLNPVDAFRIVNLPQTLPIPHSLTAALVSVFTWIAATLGLATWRLNKMDL
jgi:Cu-processing system permease protein